MMRLAEEHDNLRAVLDWSQATGQTEINLRLVGALARFWHIHGHYGIVHARIDTALVMPGAVTYRAAGDKLYMAHALDISARLLPRLAILSSLTHCSKRRWRSCKRLGTGTAPPTYSPRLAGVIDPVDQPAYERNRAAARAALGEARFVAAWAEGKGMGLAAAIAYALDMPAVNRPA